MIHPTAIVAPGAQIDASADIGPYVVIGPRVKIGPETSVGSHTVVDGVPIELSIAPQHHPTGWLRARLSDLSERPSTPIGAPAAKEAVAVSPTTMKHVAMARQLALFGSTR